MPTRERSLALPIALSLSMLALATSPARAERRWADELPALRAALATYDIEGDATFAALEELGNVADASGDGAREARALRALAAADLLVVSRSDARHAALEDRLAALYGVPALELHAVLARELEAVRGGVYRGVVVDALQALALIDEVDVPIAIDWAHHTGARRDVLFLRAAATGALRAGAVLDPCADASAPCAAPWSAWDAPTRARIASLLEASAAARRLARAAASGDPLVRAIEAQIALHRASIEAAHVDPTVWLAGEQDLLPAQDGDVPVRIDRLLVIGRGSLDALHTPPVAVRDGQVVAVDGVASVGLARSPFAIASLGASLEAPLRAGLGTIVRGASLAIAPTTDASCEVVWRVLGEARRLGVGSVVVVRRAHDGSLAGQTIALVDEPAPDARGEVMVRVRPAYLVIERNAEHSLIARHRGEDGLAADLPELQRAVQRGETRRVTISFAGEARTADVVQVALTLARDGRARVGLAVR